MGSGEGKENIDATNKHIKQTFEIIVSLYGSSHFASGGKAVYCIQMD